MNRIKLTLAQTRRFSNYVDGITWLRTQIKGLTTDLVVLPENWVGTRILSNGGEFNEYVEMLKAIAEDINALIIGGAVYVNINGRNVSICPMVNEKGLVNYSEKVYPSRQPVRGWR